MGYSDLNRAGVWGLSRTSGAGSVPTPICRILDTNGDGTGTKNANGDYQAGSDIFYIQPSASKIFRLSKMKIVIRGEKGKIKSDWYVEDSALSVGIQIRLQNDSGTIADFTDNVKFKRIGDYGRLDSDIKLFNSSDESDTYGFAIIMWSPDADGYPLRLDGASNERLEVVLNDDFSTLDEHYFTVQGYYEKE